MAVDTGMYCLNVGQGSCTVIIDRVPGRPSEFQAAIVDVGGNGKQLAKWLRHYGVTRIIAVALTHHDDDHIRGLGQLVQAFKQKIETLWILPDRTEHPKRLWIPSQKWRDERWICRIKRLEAPSERPPGLGECLTGPLQSEYALYCIYPEVYDVESVVHGADRTGEHLGDGPNAASAVLRIAIPTADPRSHEETQVLIGGDLDYLGWNHLVETGHDLKTHIFVVPHHGGPAEATNVFGETQLVDQVKPSAALISVGTEKNSGAKPYGHPHKTLVKALRASGASVLCTQLTPQCVADPSTVPSGAVLVPLAPVPVTWSSGVACAGTVVVRLTDTSPPTVTRIADHILAVNQLQTAGHAPLCR
jgi:beta-lactamase superfamily II metal-dependent hydrolase